MQDDKDVTAKVEKLVSDRFKEILNRKRKSSIVIENKHTEKRASIEQVDELMAEVKKSKAENESLKGELSELKNMIGQLLAEKQASQTVDNQNDSAETKTSVKAKTSTRNAKTQKSTK